MSRTDQRAVDAIFSLRGAWRVRTHLKLTLICSLGMAGPPRLCASSALASHFSSKAFFSLALLNTSALQITSNNQCSLSSHLHI